MPVDYAKQNKHRWWGILTLDVDTPDLKKGDRCVFVKTKLQSHFVNEGTYVLEVNRLGTVEDAKQVFRKIPEVANYISAIENDLNTIGSELLDAKLTDLPVVEIVKIDEENTSPLTLKLNEYTRLLFSQVVDPTWLEKYGSLIGKDDVLAALRMK